MNSEQLAFRIYAKYGVYQSCGKSETWGDLRA